MCGRLRIVLGAPRAVRGIHELVRHGVPMPTDSNDAVHAMELIDECYRPSDLSPVPATVPHTEGA
jgi:hypothetical protein